MLSNYQQKLTEHLEIIYEKLSHKTALSPKTEDARIARQIDNIRFILTVGTSEEVNAL